MTRVYVATNADAPARAIANKATGSYVDRSDLLLNPFGGPFYTMLFNCQQSGPGSRFGGTVTQPALGIEAVPVHFADDIMSYGGWSYELDVNATVEQVITKPVMRVSEVVQTYAGLYIAAQNLLDGMSRHYLNGAPLTITGGSAPRHTDLVAYARYEGHEYLVRGNFTSLAEQVATFDGQPATQLAVDDHKFAFADDLSTVVTQAK